MTITRAASVPEINYSKLGRFCLRVARLNTMGELFCPSIAPRGPTSRSSAIWWRMAMLFQRIAGRGRHPISKKPKEAVGDIVQRTVGARVFRVGPHFRQLAKKSVPERVFGRRGRLHFPELVVLSLDKKRQRSQVSTRPSLDPNLPSVRQTGFQVAQVVAQSRL